MASRFKQITLAEFVAMLGQFRFTRRVTGVHMHHTWRPNRKQYAGRASIEAMWQYHTQHNGWSDIAQHISIAPDGTIWTGRNWNLAPASASGHNGNSLAGPFMFEMIGDFDKGRDLFDGAQRHTALHVVAHVQQHFQLPLESLHFHSQMSTKTCPGSSISYSATLQEVKRIRATLGTRRAAMPAKLPAERLAELQRALGYTSIVSRARGQEPEALAEPAEEGMSRQQLLFLTAPADTTEKPLKQAARRARPRAAGELTAAQHKLLRAHVVNLDQGRFSTDGAFTTSAADVDALFETHLEQALHKALAAGQPLELLLYAHGGLVAEKSGLASALRYIPWWKANHVYPLYFVWETGLGGTLGALIRGSRTRELSRGITDLSDKLIERAVGPLGGQIWKNMKDSAEWASEADGGGHYVAQKLHAFCAAHAAEVAADQLRLHAVGHSAGSIFHAHFLPTTLHMGTPAFRTLQLLAPAIRIDAFRQQLAGLLTRGIGQLTVYTMRDELERADTCSLFYRKSLLYLLHHALESEHETPILGLEASLRDDAEVSRLLGLQAGYPATAAEVVWSSTTEPSGRSSSTSTTHGGFDNDPATMESVLRRVLNRSDIVPFPRTRTLTDIWHEPIELPEEIVMLAQAQAEAAPKPPKKVSAPAAPTPATPNGHPRQRALCIGINDYAAAPLQGCVADAHAWAAALQRRGFATELLLEAQATRQNILDGISRLLSESRAGDVVVVQFSGHGTQMRDENAGDEADGQDEALCPHDYARGAFVLDDDLRAVFRRVPPGVNATFFADCCHSGSVARLFGSPATPVPAGQRARFMRARTGETDFNVLHHAFRASLPADPAARKPADASRTAMRVVNFSACLPEQVAYESNGSGAFTVRALQLLEKAASVTHKQFQDQLRRSFLRHTPLQSPTLDCAPTAQELLLLQPLAKTARAPRRRTATTAS
ncbi:caspase family protein [Hymenobacter puniceus]|uniref:caspase family protein n=1 Tax=Hymenobacter sp. BT190 TaxID=2763505 RepID=UPI001651ABB2|nr:caspase family protein [Hymenobacter sp. BT190]MBC6699350.1 caspase family protein [Hymenobacter sp. BT190]